VCRVDDSMPRFVKLDSFRLRQVLYNLLDNAIKFTNAGEVRLFATFEAESGNSEGELVIGVEDTGKGIRPEEMSAIFKPFSQQSDQAPGEYGGTGLGLTISKKLVNLMGGDIHLESTPDKGSVFTVVIPGVPVVKEIIEND